MRFGMDQVGSNVLQVKLMMRLKKVIQILMTLQSLQLEQELIQVTQSFQEQEERLTIWLEQILHKV